MSVSRNVLLLGAVVILMGGAYYAGKSMSSPMEQPADSAKSGDVVSAHLASFGAGNMEALIGDYADDAVLITQSGMARGKAEITTVFEGMFAEFGQEGVVFNLADQSCDGNVCQIVWDAETPDNSYELGTDTFVIDDGKIVSQTLAAKVTPRTPEPPAGADEDAILAGGDAFEQAYNSGEGAAVAALYTEDGVLLPPGGARVDGVEAIAEFWSGAIESGLANVEIESAEIDVLGDTAIEVGYLAGTVPGEGEETTAIAGKFVVIWKRDADGNWMMHRDTWNMGR